MAREAAGIPSSPYAFAFAVAIGPLDRLRAVRVPARMRSVLNTIVVIVDGGTRSVLVPHRPLSILLAIAVVALEHLSAAGPVSDEGAVLDRFAVDDFLAPDLFAFRWGCAHQGRAGRTCQGLLGRASTRKGQCNGRRYQNDREGICT